MSEDIKVRRVGAVEHIELNRPEALNAWTPDMGRSLLGALREAAADPAVRSVLITGAGRGFSAGADVKVPREYEADGAPDLHSRLEQIYGPIILEIRAMLKPVVAAVHGPVAGLGASLAFACDMLLASETASFLLAFVRLGLSPDGGVLPHLIARIGAIRAAQLAMLGEKLPATTAYEWGLVNGMSTDADIVTDGLGLAQRLADGPTVALGTIKQLMNASTGLDLEALLALEAKLQQRHAATADYAEGVAAFKEKRPARFTGQ